MQGVPCLLIKVPQYSVKHVSAHSYSHWDAVLNKYIEVCFLLFTIFHRLTAFYLRFIKYLWFILRPAESLSYNSLKNSCSCLFFSHVYRKLLESQNCANFNFQFGERICVSPIGSTTFSESLYFPCFSMYCVAGTTWESSNHFYSWGQWTKTGKNLQSKALLETQVKTHVQNPLFNSWLLICISPWTTALELFLEKFQKTL